MEITITCSRDEKLFKLKKRHHRQLETLLAKQQKELDIIKNNSQLNYQDEISSLIKNFTCQPINQNKLSNISDILTVIIIEPRRHDQLYKVVNRFLSQLHKSLKFIIFHSEKNQDFIFQLFAPEIREGKIKMVRLATDNLKANEYNHLLKSPFIYRHITTPKFLLFQTDTYLNNQSKYPLQYFLGFDYIGGESYGLKGLHGNGGMSLRNTLLSLKAIYHFGPKYPDIYPEDVFFYHHIKTLSGKVGDIRDMSVFCCNYSNTNPYLCHPLFLHKLVDGKKNTKYISKYCPVFRDITQNIKDLASEPEILHRVSDETQAKYVVKI